MNMLLLLVCLFAAIGIIGLVLLFGLLATMSYVAAGERDVNGEAEADAGYAICTHCHYWYDDEGRRHGLAPLPSGNPPVHYGICGPCMAHQLAVQQVRKARPTTSSPRACAEVRQVAPGKKVLEVAPKPESGPDKRVLASSGGQMSPMTHLPNAS